MHQVEPQDATFLYIEGENLYTHATTVWLYDAAEAPGGDISRSDLMRHIRSRLHLTSLLYQKLVRVPLDLDYPYWVDDEDFDVENHVEELILAEPGDWPAFRKCLSEIHSRPLDMDRPLWQMYLVKGFRVDWLPENAFALLFKIHHVGFDGATGMVILQGFHDREPLPIPKTVKTSLPEPAEAPPGALRMLSAALRNNLNHSFKGIQALAGLAGRLPAILSTVRVESMLRGAEAPKTLFNRDISTERVVDLRFFDLAEIKQIRHAVPGATVNDVLLTICGGALRRFLESKGDLPEDSMLTVCPINVRTREEAESGGNRIAMMTTSFHTEIADPLERLKAVHRSTRRAKAVVESVGAREMQELNNSLPCALQVYAIRAMRNIPGMPKLPRMFNTSTSNLPGPQQTYYLGGAKLLQMGGGMPVGDGYGLFLGICTYDGKLSFSVTSAQNILPEPDQLMVQFEHAVAELVNAAGALKKPAGRADTATA